jgi:hypothetical protein
VSNRLDRDRVKNFLVLDVGSKEDRLILDRKDAITPGEQLRVFVWGEICYDDAFETQRQTMFRMMFNGDEAYQIKSLQIYTDGNEAT